MTEPSPRRSRASTPVATGAPASLTATGGLDPAALTQAMQQLMEPLATLAIARGVPFATLEGMLKSAFIESARAAHPNLPGHRLVSRISTATGINRREVARITEARSEAPAVHRSPATRVFTKWLGDPSLKTREGTVKALPRQGPAPSFEALAQSVTRDVHPRSLLDELCRLGLARLDGDTVHLEHDSFVPKGDTGRMLGFLGSNVGDHLQAAVANVLCDTPPHLEQAVFADGLSPASLEAFRQLMRTQWKSLLDATVPALQQLIDADRAAGRPQNQRVRVGLYAYSDAMMPAAHKDPAIKAPAPPRKAASKPTET